MKASLALKMSQNLAMTPQLQQAIKLLQLSTLDLQQEIQAMLDANPLLELEDNNEDFNLANNNEAKTVVEENLEPISLNDDYLNQDYDSEVIPQDLAVDAAWEDVYQTSASNLPSATNYNDNDFSANDAKGQSLHEYLLWQLNTAPMNDKECLIAEAIIDMVNNQGYIEDDIKALVKIFSKELKIKELDILKTLEKLQKFEPAGVCARNLQECLLIQLKQLPTNTPLVADAINLVNNYLDVLGSRDFKKITKLMHISAEKLQDIIKLIQSLNPRPGLAISDLKEEYVIPDLIVKKVAGNWQVELNQKILPKLKINSYYADLAMGNDKQDNGFIRNNLQDAKWFIKSLHMRNETLLKVAKQIVQQQKDFFEHGESAMKPMVLQDIASNIEMHESTVSRVTTQKYIHTPQGVYELKFFFSTSLTNAAGESSSATAVKALIKKLISAEDPKHPLSDSKLVILLKEQGVNVARRTVAKYRENLGIAATSVRKHLL